MFINKYRITYILMLFISLCFFEYFIWKIDPKTYLIFICILCLHLLLLSQSIITKLIVFFEIVCISTVLFLYHTVLYITNLPLDKFILDVVDIVCETNIDELCAFYEYINKKTLLVFVPCFLLLITFKGYHKKIKIFEIALAISCIVCICSQDFFIKNSIKVYINHKKDITEAKEAEKLRATFRWNAKSLIKGKSIAVVILGETTRGDHCSCNGYKKKTTPFLDNEDIITFTNAISQGSHTLASTPLILTRQEPDFSGNFKESSIFSAYKEAGYVTYYISYLPLHWIGDTRMNQIFIEADNYIHRKGKYDEEAIPIIRSILHRNEEKQLIILKIIGSHFNYHDRYPEGFNYFTPSYTNVRYSGPRVEERDILVNTYDNSIRYTDFVVHSILSILKEYKSDDCTLSFISDHGTHLFEDGVHSGRYVSKESYNILYFFWANEKAKNRLGNVFPILKDNTKRPVDASSFFDTQLYLSGIMTDKKKGVNLFEPQPELDARRVLAGSDILFYKKLP